MLLIIQQKSFDFLPPPPLRFVRVGYLCRDLMGRRWGSNGLLRQHFCFDKIMWQGCVYSKKKIERRYLRTLKVSQLISKTCCNRNVSYVNFYFVLWFKNKHHTKWGGGGLKAFLSCSKKILWIVILWLCLHNFFMLNLTSNYLYRMILMNTHFMNSI